MKYPVVIALGNEATGSLWLMRLRASVFFAAGTDTSKVRREDAGLVLSDTVKRFMYDLKVDNGLKAIGLTSDNISKLVKGTLPQVD